MYIYLYECLLLIDCAQSRLYLCTMIVIRSSFSHHSRRLRSRKGTELKSRYTMGKTRPRYIVGYSGGKRGRAVSLPRLLTWLGSLTPNLRSFGHWSYLTCARMNFESFVPRFTADCSTIATLARVLFPLSNSFLSLFTFSHTRALFVFFFSFLIYIRCCFFFFFFRFFTSMLSLHGECARD